MADIRDHGYISTACWHVFHDECRKVCKFCGSECRCECHKRKPTDEAPALAPIESLQNIEPND